MNPRSPRIAILILALCCIAWGLSFPILQLATSLFERAHGTALPTILSTTALRATFNGWRFLLAAAVYGLLTIPHQRSFTRQELQAGAVIGAFTAGGMLLQVVGLAYALPSISGFLTALSVIFAPLAQAILFGRPVGRRTWVAVAIATAGIAILAQSNPGANAEASHGRSIPPIASLGEIATIVAALFFTGQILAVDRVGPGANIQRITFLMFLITGLLSLLAGLALCDTASYRPAVLARLLADRPLLLYAAFLILIPSVLAFHLMTSFQPLISPATAAVVYCLEPLFATLFSILFHTERLTPITTLGGAVLLIAVFVVARTPPKQSDLTP